MFLCPRCAKQPLAATRSQRGQSWICPTCQGHMIAGKMLRGTLQPQTVRALKAAPAPPRPGAPLPCPACRRAMTAVLAPRGVQIDRCRRCDLWWFDKGELQAVGAESEAAAAPDVPAGHAPVGLYPPDSGWKFIVTLAGMPAEIDAPPLHRPPLITWSLAALTLLVSLYALLFVGDEAFTALGLIPERALRLGGITFLTTFFLHGSLLHLFGNLYFLMIFGDNVEDLLGRGRYLLLLLLATLAGGAAHCALEPNSAIPLIGASGGISGVILFYALSFPRVGISLFIRIWWIQIPALWAFFAWLGLQFLIARAQLQGTGDVSALGHLGGASVGFLFWLASNPHAPSEIARRS